MDKNYSKEIYKILTKGGKNSCGGFYLLLSLIAGAISLIIWLVVSIVKYSIKKHKQVEQARVIEAEHNEVVNYFKKVIEANCYTISMEITKTVFADSSMVQYINFYIYNKYSVEIENINELINNVLYNELSINKKGEHKGCVIIKDTELELLKDKIRKVMKKEVFFRYIEEIQSL